MSENNMLKRKHSTGKEHMENNKIKPEMILCFMCGKFISSGCQMEYKTSHQITNMEIDCEKLEGEKMLLKQIICVNCHRYVVSFNCLKRK